MNRHGIKKEKSIQGWYIQVAICAMKSFNAVMNAVIWLVPDGRFKKTENWIAEFCFLYLITTIPVLFGYTPWLLYVGTPSLFTLSILRHRINWKHCSLFLT